MFFTKINSEKTYLETTIEWYILPPDVSSANSQEAKAQKKPFLSEDLQKEMKAIYLAAFLDAYQNYSEEQMGYAPGHTKENSLAENVKWDIKAIENGTAYLATIRIQDSLAGFIVCSPKEKNFYISTLAVKPFHDFKTGEKIRIGLGQQLIENVQSKFPHRKLTLDLRRINESAQNFYTKMGFELSTGVWGGWTDPKHFDGYEKKPADENEEVSERCGELFRYK